MVDEIAIILHATPELRPDKPSFFGHFEKKTHGKKIQDKKLKTKKTQANFPKNSSK